MLGGRCDGYGLRLVCLIGCDVKWIIVEVTRHGAQPQLSAKITPQIKSWLGQNDSILIELPNVKNQRAARRVRLFAGLIIADCVESELAASHF